MEEEQREESLLESEQLSRRREELEREEEERLAERLRRAAATGSKRGGFKRDKDLWSIILNERDEKGVDANNINEDYTLIFVGDKQAGKSTLICRLQERPASVKPNVIWPESLDAGAVYSYGVFLRKTNQEVQHQPRQRCAAYLGTWYRVIPAIV